MFIKKSTIILSIGILSLLTFCFNSPPDDKDLQEIMGKIRRNLYYFHYSQKPLDDNMSKTVFNNYMEYLDPFKRFFTQADIQEFKKSETQLDDYLNDENLVFYKETGTKFFSRVGEAETYVTDVLSKPIDFNKEETIEMDEKLRPYAKNEQELKEEWQKIIKFNILDEAYTISKDSTNKGLTKDQILAKATQEVKETYTDYFRKLKNKKMEDIFTIYMNAYTEAYDPHTSYMSPKNKSDFDVNISGKLEGIGASLQDKKGYATIMSLVVGGPAWLSKELEKGDKILKVAQGKNGEPENIVGMNLDDAIQLIRGKKGTTVRLTVQKKNGTIKEIALVRDVIELEESFAKSSIIEEENGDKYGIIYLPDFYIDMNDKEGRNCSDDVAKEITELKKEGVKGIILDLRDNGGGSLSEVVEIAGLFIDKGPVVQVKSMDGNRTTLEDEEAGVLWDGPLAIMVNEYSASASEILAGAMQDYKRAVIIGSNQTFGKGTVQTVMPIDRWNPDQYGALKLTIQKFYRVDGSSTQLKGVTPDIILADPNMYTDITEAKQPNALPWDKIESSNYQPFSNYVNMEKIKSQSTSRVQSNTYLQTMEKLAKKANELSKNQKFNLNYDKYMADREAREKEAKEFEALEKYTVPIKYSHLKSDAVKMEKDTVLLNRRNDWLKNLKKDFYVNETVQILEDINQSNPSYNKLANKNAIREETVKPK